MDRRPDRQARLLARKLVALALLFCLAGGTMALVPGLTLGARAQDLPTPVGRGAPISAGVRQQIAALLADKSARTPAQRKLDSNLLWKIKQLRRDPIATSAVASLRSDVALNSSGQTTVDITADVSDALLDQIRALGGVIESAFPQYHSIRAQISPLQAEQIAALAGVIFIQPAQEAMTLRMPAPASVGILPVADFAARAPLQQGSITNAINVSEGDQTHRANLARSTFGSPAWQDTAIIVTYDENGGFWDHVAPPAIDKWGPGSRVPTLIISPYAKKGFVDHTQYDTTSILKFIEQRWELAPLATRDAAANDLGNAFNFSQGANTPSKLPNTGGETLPPAAILLGIALLIGLGGMLIRRKARGA